MLNLVEKFTPEAVEATDEDGVVAIEYVLLAAAVVGCRRRPSLWPSAAWATRLDDSHRRGRR